MKKRADPGFFLTPGFLPEVSLLSRLLRNRSFCLFLQRFAVLVFGGLFLVDTECLAGGGYGAIPFGSLILIHCVLNGTASLSTAMICSSVKRFPFISLILPYRYPVLYRTSILKVY